MPLISNRKICLALLTAAFLAASAAPSLAGVYPGTASTFTSGSGDTQSLFNFSGNTMTITGDLSGSNTYYLNGVQLVGIRSVYLVNADGSAPSNISFLSGSGYVAPSAASSAKTNWVTFSSSGYKGFDDGDSGKGYSNGANWIAIADPTLAGKTSVNKETFGSFTFTGPLVSAAGKQNYDIGIDYLLAGGQSGRAYFSLPDQVSPTPEAGTLVSFGVLAMLCAGVMRKRRREIPAQPA